MPSPSANGPDLWSRIRLPSILALTTVAAGVLVTVSPAAREWSSELFQCARRSLDVLLLGVDLIARVLAIATLEILAIAMVIFVVAAACEFIRGGTGQRAHTVKVRPLLLDAKLETDAVRLAMEGYENPGSKHPTRTLFRYADRFWFEGGVCGSVTASVDGRTFVVFRGTSEIGNWFLTNGQAHTTTANAVFGTTDIDGGVHQGFAKAFADLWFEGPEPTFPPAENYTLTKYLWPILCACVVFPLWAWVPWRPSPLSAVTSGCMFGLVVVTVAFVQYVFSHGLFEGSFGRRHGLKLGPALSTTVNEAPEEPIVFTGHSIGGAIAALAFTHFCISDKTSRRAHLVTFGAPQVGNDKFLTWLDVSLPARRPATAISFIAELGDPVAHLPPASGFWRESTRRVTVLSAVLTAVYWIAWVPYAFCYRVNLGRRWAHMVSWRGRDDGISLGSHLTYGKKTEEEQPRCREQRPQRGRRDKV